MKEVIKVVVLFFSSMFACDLTLAGPTIPSPPFNEVELIYRTSLANVHDLVKYITTQRARREYSERNEWQNRAEERDYMLKLLQQMRSLVALVPKLPADQQDWKIECLYAIAKLARTLLPAMEFKPLGEPFKVHSSGWSGNSTLKKQRSIWRNLAEFTVIFHSVIKETEFTGSYEKLAARLGPELVQSIFNADLIYLRPIVERSIAWVKKDTIWNRPPIPEDALPYLDALANYWRGTAYAREVVGSIEKFVSSVHGETISERLKRICYYYPQSGEAEPPGSVNIFALLRLIIKIGEVFTEKNLDLAAIDRELVRVYRKLIRQISILKASNDALKQLKDFCALEMEKTSFTKENITEFLRLYRACQTDKLLEPWRREIQILEVLLPIGREVVKTRDFWTHPELHDLRAAYLALISNESGLLTSHHEQIAQSYNIAKALLELFGRVEKNGQLSLDELREIYLPMSQVPLSDQAKALGTQLSGLCTDEKNIFHSVSDKEQSRRSRLLQDLRLALSNSLWIRNMVAVLDQLKLDQNHPRVIALYRTVRALEQKVADFLEPLQPENYEELTEELTEFAGLLQVVYINGTTLSGIDKTQIQKNAEIFSRFIQMGAIPLDAHKLLDSLGLDFSKMRMLPEGEKLLSKADKISNILRIKLLRSPLKEIGELLREIGDQLTNTQKLKPKQFAQIKQNISQMAQRLIDNDSSINIVNLMSDLSSLLPSKEVNLLFDFSQDPSKTLSVSAAETAVEEQGALLWQKLITLSSQMEYVQNTLCGDLRFFSERLKRCDGFFDNNITSDVVGRRQAAGKELAGVLLATDRSVPDISVRLFDDVCLYNQEEIYQQVDQLKDAYRVAHSPLGLGDSSTSELDLARFSSPAAAEEFYRICYDLLKEGYERLRSKLPTSFKAGSKIADYVTPEIADLISGSEYLLTCLNQLTFKKRFVWRNLYPERVELARKWRGLRNALVHDLGIPGTAEYGLLPTALQCLEEILGSPSKQSEKKSGRVLAPLSKRFTQFCPKIDDVFGNNREIVDVAHDGNCFFHAVADQLLQNSALLDTVIKIIRKNVPAIQGETRDAVIRNLYQLLRELAVQEVSNHRRQYADFVVRDSLDNYLLRISRNGTWADGLIIQALSNALSMNIVIITDRGAELSILPAAESSKSSICLGYYTGLHYVSLRSKGESADETTRKYAQMVPTIEQKVLDGIIPVAEEQRLFWTELARRLLAQKRLSSKNLESLAKILVTTISGTNEAAAREWLAKVALAAQTKAEQTDARSSSVAQKPKSTVSKAQNAGGASPKEKAKSSQPKQTKVSPSRAQSKEVKSKITQPEPIKPRSEETKPEEIQPVEPGEEAKPSVETPEEMKYRVASDLLEQCKNEQIDIPRRIKAGNKATAQFAELAKIFIAQGSEDLAVECHELQAEALRTVGMLNEQLGNFRKAAGFFANAASAFGSLGRINEQQECIDARANVLTLDSALVLRTLTKQLEERAATIDGVIADSKIIVEQIELAVKLIKQGTGRENRDKSVLRPIKIIELLGRLFLKQMEIFPQEVTALCQAAAGAFGSATNLYRQLGETQGERESLKLQATAFSKKAETFHNEARRTKSSQLWQAAAEACRTGADILKKFDDPEMMKMRRMAETNALMEQGFAVDIQAENEPKNAAELYRKAEELFISTIRLLEEDGDKLKLVATIRQFYFKNLCAQADLILDQQDAIELYRKAEAVLAPIIEPFRRLEPSEVWSLEVNLAIAQAMVAYIQARGNDRTINPQETIELYRETIKKFAYVIKCYRQHRERKDWIWLPLIASVHAACADILDRQAAADPQNAAEMYNQAAESLQAAATNYNALNKPKIAAAFSAAAKLYEQLGGQKTATGNLSIRAQARSARAYAMCAHAKAQVNAALTRKAHQETAEAFSLAAEIYEQLGETTNVKVHVKNEADQFAAIANSWFLQAARMKEIGNLQAALAAYQEAKQAFESAAKISKLFDDEESVKERQNFELNAFVAHAWTLDIQAQIAPQEVSLYHKAAATFREAVKISEKCGDRQRGVNLITHYASGVLENANVLYDQSREDPDQRAAESYHNIAEIYGIAAGIFKEFANSPKLEVSFRNQALVASSRAHAHVSLVPKSDDQNSLARKLEISLRNQALAASSSAGAYVSLVPKDHDQSPLAAELCLKAAEGFGIAAKIYKQLGDQPEAERSTLNNHAVALFNRARALCRCAEQEPDLQRKAELYRLATEAWEVSANDYQRLGKQEARKGCVDRRADAVAQRDEILSKLAESTRENAIDQTATSAMPETAGNHSAEETAPGIPLVSDDPLNPEVFVATGIDVSF